MVEGARNIQHTKRNKKKDEIYWSYVVQKLAYEHVTEGKMEGEK
jgi:hypothetical protein